MFYSWTLLLLFIIITLCLFLVFSKVFSQPFFICQLQHFIAVCPACEQLAVADNGVVFDKNVAAYWRGKGIVHFPYHPAIQKLRRKLFGIRGSQNGSPVTSVSLLNELKNEPNNPSASIELLDFYVYNGRLHEAYDQAFETKLNFVPNLFWYQSCVKLCKSYKNKFPTLLDEEFYGNYLTALERTMALSVQDVKMPYKIMPEAVALLASFDELLYEATTLKNPSKQFLRIIDHMRGQLYFITALILYRKAKQQDLNWSEMLKSVAPLLSYSMAKCFDLREVQEKDKLGEILNICIPISIYRTQQAGYILSALGEMSPEHFIEKRCHTYSNWKHRVCEILYNTSNYRNVLKASTFMSFDETSVALENIPEYGFNSVDEFLAVSETVYPSSLHHLVWIGMQYLLVNENSICDSVLPVNFCVKLTHPLQFLLNSSSTYCENISIIDLEAFLFACIYCAKATFNHRMDKSKPQSTNILPADVSNLLCSAEQDLWWDYINQTTIYERDNEEAKAFIRKGIESVRLTGHHVLPLQLLVLLGSTFANKAATESNSAQAAKLNCRARLYWEAALILLKSPDPTNRCSVTSESMFEYQGNISLGEAAKLIFKGNRFIEMLTMKERKNVDSVFSEENSNKPSSASSMAVQPFDSADETSLKALLEQNTILMNKLEELSNIQVQRIDAVLVTPNTSNLDTMSVSQQPVSHHTKSPMSNVNVNQAVNSSLMSVTGVTTASHSSQIAPVTNSSASIPPVLVPGMDKLSASAVKHDSVTDFKPTASLPDVVEVKTSEEVNKILFENRVKLYFSHLFNEEWKERGVGQLQILKHQANGRVRILMVLENVQETCANHVLTGDMELTAKGDRGWVYYALDHVLDKEVLYIKLCVKFQTNEIANEFYKVFNQNKPTSTKTNEALKFQQTTTVLNHSSISTIPVLSSLPLVPVTNEAVKDTVPASISNIPSSKEKTATSIEKQFGDLNRKQTFTAASEKKEILVVDDNAETRSTSFSGSSLNYLSRSDGESKSFSSAAATSSALASGDRRNKGSVSFEKIGFCTGGSAFTKGRDFKGISVGGSSIFDTKLAETKPRDGSWNFTFSSASKNSPKQTESFPKLSHFTFNAERGLNTEPKKKETLVADDENKKRCDSLFSSDSKWNLGLPFATTSSTPVLVETEKKSLMSFGNFEKTIDSSYLSKDSDGSVSITSKKLENFTEVGTPLSDANVAQTKFEKTFNSPLLFKNSAEQTESSSLQTPESHSNKNSGEKCVSTTESTPTSEPEPMKPRTDEENLDVLYEERCELFEFTEWKERGVGKMKILRDPNNNTIQLLMKTDLEHKVCCNQLLTTIRKMKPLTTNTAWYWDGTDYSDGEPKYDSLCVRFRTVQMATIYETRPNSKFVPYPPEVQKKLSYKSEKKATAFKNAFDDAITQLSEVTAASTLPATPAAASPSLAEMLENYLSRWKCIKCNVANKKERTVCVACRQPKECDMQLNGNEATIGGISSDPPKLHSSLTVTSAPSLSAGLFDVPASATPSTCSSSSSATVLTPANSSCQVTTSIAVPFSLGNSLPQQADKCGLLVKTSNSVSYFEDKRKVPTKSCGDGVKPMEETKCQTDSSSVTLDETGVSTTNWPATSTTNAVRFSLPVTAVVTSSALTAPLFSKGTAKELGSERRRIIKGARSGSSSQNESGSPSKSNEKSVKLSGEVKSPLVFTGGIDKAAVWSFGAYVAPATDGFNFKVSTSLPVTSSGVLTAASSENGASNVPDFSFGNSSSQKCSNWSFTAEKNVNGDVKKNDNSVKWKQLMSKNSK